MSLTTFYWSPKLHKNYKARFIANSSFCSPTELSKLLISCHTAVKNVLFCTVQRYMIDPWSIKNSGEILDKLKARDFNATSLST